MTSAELLFACVRYAVCGLEMRDEEKKAAEPQALQALYELSARHDMAHIAGSALQKNGLLPDGALGQMFRHQKDLAVYRYLQQSAALEEICAALEEAGIAHVPLKGSVIRDYYPEPWMRTSCDIDILVHEEDIQRAIKLLAECLNYKIAYDPDFHDASLYSPAGVHLELHFHIREGAHALDSVLMQVWEYAQSTKGHVFRHELAAEFSIFYHLAHMSYHFTHGGCGLRFFLDCYLLKNILPYSQEKLSDLLGQGGIAKFAGMVFSYSETWFSPYDSEVSASDPFIYDYVINSGIYGTRENSICAQQAHGKSAAQNILRRIWVPYETLQGYYGVRSGKKFLIPFYQAKRWYRFLFKKKKLKQGVTEVVQNLSVSADKRAAVKRIFDDLGFADNYDL